MGYAKVRFGVEIYYSVVQPDDLAGAEWNLHLYMIPAAPSRTFQVDAITASKNVGGT